MIDRNRQAVFRDGDLLPAAASMWPASATLDWTKREAAGDGTLVSGVRRFEAAEGPCWILIAAKATGRTVYWPVIAANFWRT